MSEEKKSGNVQTDESRRWAKCKPVPPVLCAPSTNECIVCTANPKVNWYSLCRACLGACSQPARFYDMSARDLTRSMLGANK